MSKQLDHEAAAHEKRNWVRLTSMCNNKCTFCLDTLAHNETMAAEEEINLSLKRTSDRCARESEQAATAIATIDHRIKEQAESGQATVRVIEAELASLPPAFGLKRLVVAGAEAPTSSTVHSRRWPKSAWEHSS